MSNYTGYPGYYAKACCHQANVATMVVFNGNIARYWVHCTGLEISVIGIGVQETAGDNGISTVAIDRPTHFGFRSQVADASGRTSGCRNRARTPPTKPETPVVKAR